MVNKSYCNQYLFFLMMMRFFGKLLLKWKGIFQTQTRGCNFVQPIHPSWLSVSVVTNIVRRPVATIMYGAVAKLRINSFQNSMVWGNSKHITSNIIISQIHIRLLSVPGLCLPPGPEWYRECLWYPPDILLGPAQDPSWYSNLQLSSHL